jgi:hypothetical protein
MKRNPGSTVIHIEIFDSERDTLLVNEASQFLGREKTSVEGFEHVTIRSECVCTDQVSIIKFFIEEDGAAEPTAFLQTAGDEVSIARLRSEGLVQLEAFVRKALPDFIKAVAEWKKVYLEEKPLNGNAIGMREESPLARGSKVTDR